MANALKEATAKNAVSKETKGNKRNIKNITKKNNSEVIEKKDVNISKKAVEKKKEIKKQPKKKRTLSLNLKNVHKKDDINQDISPSISHVVDTSINQNSPFFYEPSVFEKFNINITSVDSENTEITDSTIELEDTNNSTNEISEETAVQNILVSDSNIEENIENSLEQISEIERNTEDSLELDSDAILEEFVQGDDAIFDIISEEMLSEDLEIEKNESNAEIEKLPENILEKNISADSTQNPVGKFFDSSIPSITKNNNSETPFSKIKKSIFSNISPIFKKFTFEEATLVTNSNREEIEVSAEPVLQEISTEKTSVNLLDNLNVSPETDFEMIAKPVNTVPQIKEVIVTNNELDNTENIEENYPKIITPETNENTTSIDDEILEELINNADFVNDELELDLESSISKDLEAEIDYEENYLDTENDLNQEYEINSVEDLDNVELKPEEEYNDEVFSIEKYFGLDKLKEEDLVDILPEKKEEVDEVDEIQETPISPAEFEKEFLEANPQKESEVIVKTEIISDKTSNSELDVESKINNTEEKNNESSLEVDSISTTVNLDAPNVAEFSKLIENFNKTISTLSDRIANLESEKSKLIENISNMSESNNSNNLENINSEDISENFENNDLENTVESLDILENTKSQNEEDLKVEDILSDAFLSETSNIDDTLKNELLSEVLSDSELEEFLLTDLEQENNVSEENSNLENTDDNQESNIEEKIENDSEETNNEIDDNELEDSLLEDILLENIYKEDLEKINALEINSPENENIENDQTLIKEITKSDESEPISDFFTIINSLSKTIEDLENSPEIKNSTTEVSEELSDTAGKSINILINKDDIFSISILNETYEIVADFDGISVLSENIHISTPKNNFFVYVGNKHIEIHNKKDHFVVTTNFEDVEFANAINNVTFAKKNNKIELNIKEAFKLASANNTLELSMLNTNIANINSQNPQDINENSICDNRTLLISEETQKVYLPYTIEDVMKKLNSSNDYQTPKEVIENEYIVPLSTFKMPIISRFKEAYKFMRIKEKSSIYAAVDLALELMFNSELNPAIIRAVRDLKELNIYLDCLYENEVDKFDCFKIVYKVLPKIK